MYHHHALFHLFTIPSPKSNQIKSIKPPSSPTHVHAPHTTAAGSTARGTSFSLSVSLLLPSPLFSFFFLTMMILPFSLLTHGYSQYHPVVNLFCASGFLSRKLFFSLLLPVFFFFTLSSRTPSNPMSCYR